MRSRPASRVKFRYLLWHWTEAEENLFVLAPMELSLFTLLVAEANKYSPTT